jgi:predicted secreted Zn-dependent protease
MKHVVALAITCAVCISTAEADSRSRIANYAVAGKTPHDIVEIIKSSAPRVAANPTFAYTTPATRTIVKLAKAKGSCKFAGFRTSAFYVFTLPKHIKPETMSKATKAKWLDFVSYLTVHEQGHAKSWDACFADYDQQALKLQAKSCERLDKSREKLFTSIKRACLELDEKMDFYFRKEVQSTPFLKEALRQP